MNRAERRRQQARKGAQALGHLEPIFVQALAYHRAGRLELAASLYRQVLAAQPRHADSLHLLGLIAYSTGQLEEAARLIAEATKQESAKALYQFNLGVVLEKLGKLDDAVAAYRRAVALNPLQADAWRNLGNIWLAQGEVARAEEAYRQAVRCNPASADAYNNLGVALKEQGRIEEAVRTYEQALQHDPQHLEAQNNLGVALRDQGKLEEAIETFSRILASKPDYAKAHYDRAFAYLWQGNLDCAVKDFRASAELKHNHGAPVLVTTVSKARIRHDAEQIRYLMDRGVLGREYTGYCEALERLRERAAQLADRSWLMSVTADEARAIAPSFNRILYYADCPQVLGGAVNPALDVAALEARYTERKPEILVVDGLLTEEALSSLRRFCLESTIWKRDYPNGYTGTFLGDGFACPLLLQIAEELRARFPAIFKRHRLMQAWSFKQDNTGTALAMHADAAAVNVNFWITSDEANLDPDSGGLVVWDREAPLEWNFKEYNNARNEPRVLQWLRRQGAHAITIPYRSNRAVIFNSDLFHKSDRFRFRDTYEDRRLNVTLLYGRRGEA
jgi:tetratricopeptide (TPR) repeat protein